MKLSYHLLKQTWAEDEPLTTCLRDDGLVNPTYVCNELYEVSSKCSELPDFTLPGTEISITRNSNSMICRQDEEPVTEGEELESEEEESATSGHNDSQLKEEEEEEEEGTNGDDAYHDEEEPMWAKFHSSSIKFDRCHVDDYGQSYVVFRAYDSIQSANCSDDKYDEYSVYMHTYMDNALRYRKQVQTWELEELVQKEYCSTCTDEDCKQECDTLISNLLLGTYLDASELIRCQELQRDIYTGDVLYVGALCASGGSRIEIGVFTDYQCMNHDETKIVEDYLKKKEGFSITWSQTTDSMKVSYYLLKQIYDKDECTIPCSEGEDDEDGIVLNTVCEELSVGATKCSESPDFIQFPVSEVTSIERSSNSNAKTMICGGKAEGLPPLSSLDTTSEEEDEYEGDIDEYVLGDFDEEAKAGTHEDSSSTYIQVRMIVLVITCSAYFMF